MTACEHFERVCTAVTSDAKSFHHMYTCKRCGDQAFDTVLKAPEFLAWEQSGGAG